MRGESVAIIAHALHEEIIKHKKDAIEWGILGGGGGAVPEDGGYRRNQRGPRRLRGVWRDWMEFKDYGPRMEILTPEELEKKEMERERASRYEPLRYLSMGRRADERTILGECGVRRASSNEIQAAAVIVTIDLRGLRGFGEAYLMALM